MAHDSTQQRFSAALHSLIAQVKKDRSVLAALLCGSLSHDIVWAKSDIDLVLVTIDDKKVDAGDLSLYADGVNVHTILIPRSEFRRLVGGSVHHSIMQAFLAKGRLLYTHDETIANLCATLADVGPRDRETRLLHAATAAVPAIYKAHKWFVTREDLDYTALWILAAATPLAQIEVVGAGLLADREVILQALALNPAFFKTIYVDLLNEAKTHERVQRALDAVDTYMAERATTLFKSILDYLREIGEARSCREIEDHFTRNLGVEGTTTACEYLADQGLIGKASTQASLTRKSNVEIQELAFFHLEGPLPGRNRGGPSWPTSHDG
jgi:hypothetical protein